MRYRVGFFPSLTADININTHQKPVNHTITGFFLFVKYQRAAIYKVFPAS